MKENHLVVITVLCEYCEDEKSWKFQKYMNFDITMCIKLSRNSFKKNTNNDIINFYILKFFDIHM